jgi:hypothetical protein
MDMEKLFTKLNKAEVSTAEANDRCGINDCINEACYLCQSCDKQVCSICLKIYHLVCITNDYCSSLSLVKTAKDCFIYVDSLKESIKEVGFKDTDKTFRIMFSTIYQHLNLIAGDILGENKYTYMDHKLKVMALINDINSSQVFIDLSITTLNTHIGYYRSLILNLQEIDDMNTDREEGKSNT